MTRAQYNHTAAGTLQGAESSSATSTPSTSPAKSTLKLSQAEDLNNEVSLPLQPPSVSTALHSTIAILPTTNQPVLDTTLRDMLLTVQSSIHSEIANMIQHFNSEIFYMGNRVTNIESKMGEITSSFNDMVDAQGEDAEDIELS